jgi:hypothetical protein
MSTAKDNSTRPSTRSGKPRSPRSTPSDPSSQPPPALPAHVFAPEYLSCLAERDEPDTAGEADTAGPWHVEPDPKGGWAVLRQGESYEKSTLTIPTATFERREVALLAAAVLPGLGRPRFRLATDAADRGQPILEEGRIVGHSEYFYEDFIAALNVAEALMASPRDFALLLDAIGGLALEHVDKIAVARLGDPAA